MNASDRKYNDEEIKKIKELLYQLARIEYELNQKKVKDGCCNIHKGIN